MQLNFNYSAIIPKQQMQTGVQVGTDYATTTLHHHPLVAAAPSNQSHSHTHRHHRHQGRTGQGGRRGGDEDVDNSKGNVLLGCVLCVGLVVAGQVYSRL